VLAIEALAAAQALDFLKPLAPGRGVAAAHAAFRRTIRTLDSDRVLAPDIERATAIVAEERMRAAAEKVVGALA